MAKLFMILRRDGTHAAFVLEHLHLVMTFNASYFVNLKESCLFFFFLCFRWFESRFVDLRF